MYYILYLDDEPVLLDVVKSTLDSEYMTIIPVSNVDDAVAYIKNNVVDVIITDYDMVENGIEFLKKVRLLFDRLPVIVFTGKSREDVAISALNEGADFYIVKGGNSASMFRELQHLIMKCIERKSHENIIIKLRQSLSLIPDIQVP